MANLSTVSDLRNDALWVAGEAQTSASSYYARSLEYLNTALRGLLAGGPFGALDLPAVDWWWAYHSKRGQVVIPNAFNTNQAISATFTQNSATVNLSVAATVRLGRWRVAILNDQDQLYRVISHAAAGGANVFTIDLPHQKATVTTAGWTAWRDHILLPWDFDRFATALKIGRYPYEIELTDMVSLERRFPRSRLWLGTPQCAALINPEALEAFTFATTDVSIADNAITELTHAFVTGDGPVRFTTTTTIPAGIVAGTDYWIVRVDADTFKIATSYDNAVLGTVVDITSQGVGTHTCTPQAMSPGLHLSHMLQDGPIVAEFEYLSKQAELVDVTGTEEPPLPHQHRRVLSLGAAYLMLFDKVDSKYAQVGKMFESAWQVMAEEQYRQTTDNENFGRILSRQREVSSKRHPLRSPTGFIYG